MPSARRTRSTPLALQKCWNRGDRDARRNLIVEVAIDLLNTQGLPAVTIRRVARRLSVGAMTLYTYVEGQQGLRTAMVKRGFDLLQAGCDAKRQDTDATCDGTDPDATEDVEDIRGAHQYVRFAVENPALYQLMFSSPADAGDEDEALLRAAFSGYLEHMREIQQESARCGANANTGIQSDGKRNMAANDAADHDNPDHRALRYAGRRWMALHGLASLAINNRLGVLDADLDELVNDLLDHLRQR